jgi:hypothetical protein
MYILINLRGLCVYIYLGIDETYLGWSGRITVELEIESGSILGECVVACSEFCELQPSL